LAHQRTATINTTRSRNHDISRDLSFFVAQELSPRLKGSDRYRAEDLAILLLLHPAVLADELAVAINIGREPRRWAKDFTDSVEEARKYRPVATR